MQHIHKIYFTQKMTREIITMNEQYGTAYYDAFTKFSKHFVVL